MQPRWKARCRCRCQSPPAARRWTAGADGGQCGIAQHVAHDHGVHGVVQLLEQVGNENGQHEQHQTPEDGAVHQVYIHLEEVLLPDWVWVIGFLQLYFYRKTRGRPESSPLFCRFMQLLFTKKLPAAAPLVKRQSERPAGRSDCKIKNIFPLKIARAQAAAIPIVLFTAPASQSRGRSAPPRW